MRKLSRFCAIVLCTVLCGCEKNFLLQEKATEQSAVLPIIELSEESTVTSETVVTSIYTLADLDALSINIGKNSSQNSLDAKNTVYSRSMFCYVAETDTIFFSDNNSLYQKNGDDIYVITDMKARSICNGNIYILTDELYELKPDNDRAENYSVPPVNHYTLDALYSDGKDFYAKTGDIMQKLEFSENKREYTTKRVISE